ncbi:SMI1/KNR4 family protein [Streptomyces sp. NPDC090026]|uniref:SMI1/KNR4 family protein n=1 Tax=Streptomyces sp. NPDC090026 TaxID=3365923 RepID=UPI00380470FF
MSWVSQLITAVGRTPLYLDVDWSIIESRIGITLPSDYKEFCEGFGAGEFSEFLVVHSSSGGSDSSLVASLDSGRRNIQQHPIVLDLYQPYGLYLPGMEGGVMEWGTSSQGDAFAWLVDRSESAELWPVLIREEVGDWVRYDMPMTEFVYRLLDDQSFDSVGGFGATESGPSFTSFS